MRVVLAAGAGIVVDRRGPGKGLGNSGLCFCTSTAGVVTFGAN